MSSVRCPHCGLTNFSTDLECRRCRKLIYRPTDRIISERPPRRNSLISILVFVVIAAAGYYIYTGVSASISDVGEGEAKRVAAQPKKQPEAGLSRSEADRQKSQRVANYVGVSAGLNEHNNRTRQTENTLQQLTNSNQR